MEHRAQNHREATVHRVASRAVRPQGSQSSGGWAPPKGWRERRDLGELFPRDPLLAETAGDRGLFFQRPDGGFCLAFPWAPGRPFPLAPLFCFAHEEHWNGRPFLVFRFDAFSRPLMPKEPG